MDAIRERLGVGVGGNSPIYFSQSTNGGRTWSPGIEISGANAAVCTVFQGEARIGACDQDQGSDPVVGPDGTIYVSFNNCNTPTMVNNQLIVKCPAFADCCLPGSWIGPGQDRVRRQHAAVHGRGTRSRAVPPDVSACRPMGTA